MTRAPRQEKPGATPLAALRRRLAELAAENMALRNRITESKSAAGQMTKELENLKRILHAMPDFVHIVDADYGIAYVNSAMRREFGPTSGKRCYAYLHDAGGPCSWCRMPEVQAGKTMHWEWSSEKTGKHYDVLESPVANADGSISKLKIMRDVTEQREMDRKLDDLARFPAENTNPVLRVAPLISGSLLSSQLIGMNRLPVRAVSCLICERTLVNLGISPLFFTKQNSPN